MPTKKASNINVHVENNSNNQVGSRKLEVQQVENEVKWNLAFCKCSLELKTKNIGKRKQEKQIIEFKYAMVDRIASHGTASTQIEGQKWRLGGVLWRSLCWS